MAIVKQIEETGYRARADRHIQSGRVVTLNTTDHTAILDVGMVDFNGNAVYLIDVPYSPQTPPQVNDTVPLIRTNSSAYSLNIGGGAQVGGANTGQVIGGVVTSIKNTGDSTGQVGDIILNAGDSISISRSGKTFTISFSGASVTLPVWVIREIPTGTINGSNTVFTMLNTPVLATESVYLNGLLQQSGGEDYSISGATITFVSAPILGSRILITYIQNAGSGVVVPLIYSYDFSNSINSMYVPQVF